MSKPVSKWLKAYLPTFCWQTAGEILTMLEGIDPDIDFESLKVCLNYLMKKGFVISRPVSRKSCVHDFRRVHEYLSLPPDTPIIAAPITHGVTHSLAVGGYESVIDKLENHEITVVQPFQG